MYITRGVAMQQMIIFVARRLGQVKPNLNTPLKLNDVKKPNVNQKIFDTAILHLGVKMSMKNIFFNFTINKRLKFSEDESPNSEAGDGREKGH